MEEQSGATRIWIRLMRWTGASGQSLGNAMADASGDLATTVADLLTQEEAIALLRLDQLGLQDPKESLRHLRRTGQIGYAKVAGKVLIPREEIVAYLERHSVRARG
jgi:hypothetical protein